MTKFDLFDSIGNIDEELIEKATEQKNRSTDKKIFLITGSIAACAVITVTAVFLASGRNTAVETSVPFSGGYTEKGAEISSGIMTGGANSEIPHTEESYETDIEIITSDIFYVNNGKIAKTPVEHEAKPQAVFELWKKMNHIGDEVEPSIVTATTDYGCHIHASVEKDNIFACQFHPEKSSTVGLQILKNFANL